MSFTYGGYTIDVAERLSVTQRPKTRKQTIGRTLVQTPIIGINANDNIIDIRGVLTATTAAALKIERNNLEDLNDGAKHAYADSTDVRYDSDYAIETGSLIWDRQINPLAIRFSIRLVEW